MTNSLKTDSATQFSRRQFIKTGIAAGAGFTIIPNHVLAAHGRPGANDKINHAIIGVGSMGNGHVGYVLNDPQAKLVAVCDVRKSRREAAAQRAKNAGHDCKAYLDFREMIDSEDIDVVHVVTPPHWHALQDDPQTGITFDLYTYGIVFFDPNRHNAVMHIERDDLGESVIAQVFQKGFAVGDRVIRFAMVQVAN